MNIQQQVAIAAELLEQKQGLLLADLVGPWDIYISLYGKEQLLDQASTIEEALALGITNQLFTRVEHKGPLTVSFEPGATSPNKLRIY